METRMENKKVAEEYVKEANHIHIATEGSIGLAARYYCKKYKRSYTTSFHTKYPDYLYEHAYIPPRITSRYFRWFHRNSDCVMVPTPAMVDYCSEMGIGNLKIWSRGVDTDLFRPDPNYKKQSGPIRAVYVGRVSTEKNIEAFLKVNNPNIFGFSGGHNTFKCVKVIIYKSGFNNINVRSNKLRS